MQLTAFSGRAVINLERPIVRVEPINEPTREGHSLAVGSTG
jgi:hypothetical protein